ncbi:hypothetical protein AB833_10475 [Chromatiales bacterium (ex Bugula neritina AB1)]|nr:hypothetical protein AB833_10475 [Chromatiales bacterium (ex Bugula neritina AB1)]
MDTEVNTFLYLKEKSLKKFKIESYDSYPFTIPAVEHLHTLKFESEPWCCIKFRVQKLIERYKRRCTHFLLD